MSIAVHVLAQPFAATPQPGHYRAGRYAEDTRRLFIRQILDADQKQHRALLLGQLCEAEQQITVPESCFLLSFYSGQLHLGNQGQLMMDAAPPQSVAVAAKAVEEDRIKPASYITSQASRLPTGQCALQSILDQIIGTIGIAAQQRSGKTPQTRNMGFDQIGPVWHCLARRMAAVPRPHCPPCW